MPTLNYSTTIEAAKTMGEIQEILVKHGVSSISMTYEGGKPTGLHFVADVEFGPQEFVIHADVDAVLNLLQQQRKGAPGKRGNTNIKATREQAERVAWRVIKDWLAAQLAMVEAQLSSLSKALLPYMLVAGGDTLYDKYIERGMKELEA